jgi:hypothetical protein
MIGEFDIYGVLVPTLLLWLVVAYGVYAAVCYALSAAGAYRFIWHRPLFDVALYVILLGTIVFIAAQVMS